MRPVSVSYLLDPAFEIRRVLSHHYASLVSYLLIRSSDEITGSIYITIVICLSIYLFTQVVNVFEMHLFLQFSM